MIVCRVLLLIGAIGAAERFADNERWIEWIQELNKQTATANSDFPIDARLFSNLQKCEKFDLNRFASADNLAPGDIEVFAEIGHLGVFCDDPTSPNLEPWIGEARNRSFANGFLTHDYISTKFGPNPRKHDGPSPCESCTRSFVANPLPTLDKFLAVFNPSLTVIASERATNMITQARRVIAAVKSMRNWRERWKLIVVAPSPVDSEFRSLEAMTTAVLEALGELFNEIPHRTMIAVIRVSETKIWQQASFGFEACERLLSRWNLHERNLMDSWDTLEEAVAFRYRYPSFNVQILPFMRNALLLPNNYTLDISPLGSDCVHFSARGHSLVHQEIWNTLFTRPSERSNHWRPLIQALTCPPQHCPYIQNDNVAFCVQNTESISSESAPDPEIILVVFLLLLTTALLCVILLSVILVERTPTYNFSQCDGSSYYVNYVQPDEV